MTVATTPTLVPLESNPAFPVHFSNPNPWFKFAPDPDTHWKLLGSGEVVFKRETIVLRGLRRRPDRCTVKQSAEIAMTEVLNVVREGRVVRFDVRIPLSVEKPIRLWATDELSAQEIVARLPRERTLEFDQALHEQEAFAKRLDSKQSWSYVTPFLVALNCLIFFDGVAQLAFNVLLLWSVGRMTERLLGSVLYSMTYVLAGLCGVTASLVWHHSISSAEAAAATSGVLGAMLALLVGSTRRMPENVVATVRIDTVIFVAYNIVGSFLRTGLDSVANIVGLCSGFAVGWLTAL